MSASTSGSWVNSDDGEAVLTFTNAVDEASFLQSASYHYNNQKVSQSTFNIYLYV